MTSSSRAAAEGHSTAVDAYGVVLASHRWIRGTGDVMVAQVPTTGVTTVYARVGDLFGWLTVASLAGFVVIRIVRRKKGRS